MNLKRSIIKKICGCEDFMPYEDSFETILTCLGRLYGRDMAIKGILSVWFEIKDNLECNKFPYIPVYSYIVSAMHEYDDNTVASNKLRKFLIMLLEACEIEWFTLDCIYKGFLGKYPWAEEQNDRLAFYALLPQATSYSGLSKDTTERLMDLYDKCKGCIDDDLSTLVLRIAREAPWRLGTIGGFPYDCITMNLDYDFKNEILTKLKEAVAKEDPGTSALKKLLKTCIANLHINKPDATW